MSDIPSPITPLLGRAGEMAALQKLLEQERVRLVTLTGAGGSGKSRLALELAAQLEERFDRAWFVDLTSIDRADLVPQALAEAIGVQEAAAELEQILREMLSVGRFLVIMDNFEHVLSGGTYVASLLQKCRGLVVVATSREALGLRAEHIFQVEPLATPRRDQLDDLALLRKFPSVELFGERANAVQPAFHLTDEVLPTIAEICLDLDGLPLAIELVAAQAGVLSPHEILERLTARAPLVSVGPRDLPARHRTLDSAVRWSYDLLTPDEQHTFRLSAVFAGGFTLSAMQAVSSDSNVLIWLSHLVAKNLVRVTQQKETRYWLLDTIRAFAMDRLMETGEFHTAQRQHAEFFVACAEQLQASLRGPGMAEALDNLAADYSNFRIVFQWSTSPEGDLELGLRLAGALYRFWFARGHVTEARAWLESALTRPATAAKRVRAVALNAAGVMAGIQHDRERALAHFAQSLALWEELGELPRQAGAALNLGQVAQDLGDLEQAEQRFRQAQALSAQSNDLRRQADAVGSRARIAQLQGNLQRATDLFEQSLPLSREVGDRWSEANTLANLGHVRLALDDKIGARDAFRESLQVRRDLGNVLHIAESLEDMAAVMLDDQPRLAVRLLGAAELMRRSSGAPVPATHEQRHAELVARAHNGLTPTLFRAFWNAGRVLSVNTAIDIALGIAEVPADPQMDGESSLDVLSARERDIALMIADGYSNRAIAEKLVLSVKTVETHIKHIFTKLNVRNRAGVASAVTRAS